MLSDPSSCADPHGRPVTVDPGTSAATVVVFTSSGCPYALAWHDRIQELARDYSARGVRTVQVFSNDPDAQPADRPEALARRVENGELVGDVLVDGLQEQAQRWGATATPEVFVVDRDRVVRYHGAPDGDFDEPERRADWVRDALDAVLEGPSGRQAGHLAGRLFAEVAGGAALVGGLPLARRRRAPSPVCPRQADSLRCRGAPGSR